MVIQLGSASGSHEPAGGTRTEECMADTNSSLSDSSRNLCIDGHGEDKEAESSSPPSESQTTNTSPAGSEQSASRGDGRVESEMQQGPVERKRSDDKRMNSLSTTTIQPSPSSSSTKSSSKSPPCPPSSSASCKSTQSVRFLTTTSIASASSTSPSLSASSTSSSASTVAAGVAAATSISLLRKHSAPPFPTGSSSIGRELDMADSPALSDSIQLVAAHQSTSFDKTSSVLGVEKRHKCPVCDKAFPYLSILESHKRCHTGEKPFCCHFCDKAFAQKATLQVHERTHTGERPYKCKYCPKTFAQYGTKTVHEKSAHLGIRNYKCPKCSKCLSSPSALYTHKKTHGEKSYQCQFCPKQFTLKNYLKLHVKQVHEQNERKHQCRFCSKTFAYAGSLQVHVRTHTGERPYMCKYCPKAFASQGNLQSHERTHTGERPFACQLCGRAFIQKSQLSAHEATHSYHPHNNSHDNKHHNGSRHSGSENSTSTGVSGIATLASTVASVASCEQRQLQNLAEPIVNEVIDIEGDYPDEDERTMDEGGDDSKSTHPPSINTPLANSNSRTRSVSTNEFVCKYCGKRYAYASSLYVHTRLHTGERPFRCQYCSKEFTNQGNMQVHQRVHTGEKPYKCESCGKCYAQKVGLKIHQEQCQPYLSRRGSVVTNASSTNDSESSPSIGGFDEVMPMASATDNNHTTKQLPIGVNDLVGLRSTVLNAMGENGLSHLLNSAIGYKLDQLQSLQPGLSGTQHLHYSVEREQQQLHSQRASITPQSSHASSLFSSPMHSHRPSLSELFPPTSHNNGSPSSTTSGVDPIHVGHLLRFVNQCGGNGGTDGGIQLNEMSNLIGALGKSTPLPSTLSHYCHPTTPSSSSAHQMAQQQQVTNGVMSPTHLPNFNLHPSINSLHSSGILAGTAVAEQAPPYNLLQQHQASALLSLLEQVQLHQQQQQQAYQLSQLALLKSIADLEDGRAAMGLNSPPHMLPMNQISRSNLVPLSGPSPADVEQMTPQHHSGLPQPQPIYPPPGALGATGLLGEISGGGTVGDGNNDTSNSQLYQQLLRLIQLHGGDQGGTMELPPSSSAR